MIELNKSSKNDEPVPQTHIIPEPMYPDDPAPDPIPDRPGPKRNPIPDRPDPKPVPTPPPPIEPPFQDPEPLDPKWVNRSLEPIAELEAAPSFS